MYRVGERIFLLSFCKLQTVVPRCPLLQNPPTTRFNFMGQVFKSSHQTDREVHPMSFFCALLLVFISAASSIASTFTPSIDRHVVARQIEPQKHVNT